MKKLEEYATPETDAAGTMLNRQTDYGMAGYVKIEHARKLERKLAMCRDALRGVYNDGRGVGGIPETSA